MKLTKLSTSMLGLICSLSASLAFGANIEKVATINESTTASSSEDLVVSIYVYNHSNDATDLNGVIPSHQPITLMTGGFESIVIGQRLDKPELSTLPAGGFLKVNYRITLPQQLGETIKLDIPGTNSSNLRLDVDKPTNTKGNQQSSVRNQNIHQDAFSPYKPMYFLFGVNDGLEDSSFQLSFNYKIFNSTGSITSKHPWVTGFHLGYTQKSLWDLDSESKPFEDTSYMPELYYRFKDISLNTERETVFGFQTGLLHESNGQEAEISRSTNYAYIQPELTFSFDHDYELKLANTMWFYLANDDETNADLKDYKGYMDFQAKISSRDGLALSTNIRPAKEGTSYEIDLSYPLSNLFGKNLDLYAYAKYYNGYSETLLNYSEKEEIVRVGFAVVR